MGISRRTYRVHHRISPTKKQRSLYLVLEHTNVQIYRPPFLEIKEKLSAANIIPHSQCLFSYWYNNVQSFKWYEEISSHAPMTEHKVIYLKRDHSFITCAKFPENITYLLIRTRTFAYQGVRNVSFSENFAYLLNEWSQMEFQGDVTQVRQELV